MKEEEDNDVEPVRKPAASKETNKKALARAEIEELNPIQKLFLEARKITAPIVRINASKLFDDDDSPDQPEEQEAVMKIEEEVQGMEPPVEELDMKRSEQKAAVLKRIQDNKLREEKSQARAEIKRGAGKGRTENTS